MSSDPTERGGLGAPGGETERLADAGERVIPLAKERARVDVRASERTAATIRLRTREEEVPVAQTLRRERVEIERVPVDRLVDEPPAAREEGDVTVIPIVEEVLVKRFRVIEEVRLARRTETVEVNETVTLRRQEASVEEGPSGPPRT